MRPQILILLNRTDIVEHKATIYAIVIAQKTRDHNEDAENTLR